MPVQPQLTKRVPRYAEKMTDAQRKMLLAIKRRSEADRERSRTTDAERDRMIAEVCGSGVSLREVAELFEVSHQAISKIVAKEVGD